MLIREVNKYEEISKWLCTFRCAF